MYVGNSKLLGVLSSSGADFKRRDRYIEEDCAIALALNRANNRVLSEMFKQDIDVNSPEYFDEYGKCASGSSVLLFGHTPTYIITLTHLHVHTNIYVKVTHYSCNVFVALPLTLKYPLI